MRITLLQQDTAWQSPQFNLRKIGEAIDRTPGSDLYLLPEMFTTGFLTYPQWFAEPASNPDTLRWMKARAAAVDGAICGSIAVEDKGRYYNRMYFVQPDGTVTHYDKSHLFTYGGEGKQYTAGDDRVIVEFRGVKILLEICYDLQFPMWCRNNADAEGNILYDLIVYSANYPVARRAAWETLPVARAIENQCFVAVCNRIGTDDYGEYYGGSRIIHPYGHTIADGPADTECEITGDIDMPTLLRYRKKYPTLQDIIWNKFY